MIKMYVKTIVFFPIREIRIQDDLSMIDSLAPLSLFIIFAVWKYLKTRVVVWKGLLKSELWAIFSVPCAALPPAPMPTYPWQPPEAGGVEREKLRA